jgi:transposase InsO family protein
MSARSSRFSFHALITNSTDIHTNRSRMGNYTNHSCNRRDSHRPRITILERTQRRIQLHRVREQWGIRHILGGIGKPTTLGKIERWFRTYDLEHARLPLHKKSTQYYNHEWPHTSLSHRAPAEVYFRDVQHLLG